MYSPPSGPLTVKHSPLLPDVTCYKSISYVVERLFDDVQQSTHEVRIFFLHGNNGDIYSTYDMRMHFLNNLNNNLPRALQGGVCDVQLITIDYPTFGISARKNEDAKILGTKKLDEQILEVFRMLKTDSFLGLNIVWSYSIGTRYASQLLVNEPISIDFAYMQSPYYSFPVSSAHLFAGFCNGPEGEGVSVIQKPMNILFHFAQQDEFFPPSISMDLLKLRTHKGYIMQPGANHQWFDTTTAAEVGATIIGKEIGDLFLKKCTTDVENDDKDGHQQDSSE